MLSDERNILVTKETYKEYLIVLYGKERVRLQLNGFLFNAFYLVPYKDAQGGV